MQEFADATVTAGARASRQVAVAAAGEQDVRGAGLGSGNQATGTAAAADDDCGDCGAAPVKTVVSLRGGEGEGDGGEPGAQFNDYDEEEFPSEDEWARAAEIEAERRKKRTWVFSALT